MPFSFIILLVSIIKADENCDNEFEHNVNYDVSAERVYYVACVEEEWDYAPSGMNLLSGNSITEDSEEGKWLYGDGVDRIGSIYLKALYREFTDACYTQQIRSEADEHLGALGPNIRALTGEKIKIFYKNLCSFPTSIHAHGVAYDKNSEGAPYVDNDGVTGGDIVAEDGGTWIYIWYARPNMVDKTISSKMWLYHSHVNAIMDSYAGLFGAIIITRKGQESSNTNLKPKDIDKEFTTFMVLYDEKKSSLFQKNLEMISNGDNLALLNDEDFIASNRMHSINGYLFGNLNNLLMNKCENIRWYTGSFGNEGDGPHSPHWHGNIAIDSLGDNLDTLVLIPGTTYTVTMIVDIAGIWLYHCHVFHHIHAGMITTYTVINSDNDIDSDADGITDACDKCPNYDDNIDTDNDGIPDACDVCPGGDDNIDNNNNGRPDDCESCCVDYPNHSDACQGLAPGNYHSCDDCHVFITCVPGDPDPLPYIMTCPYNGPGNPPLEYDADLNACVYEDQSTTIHCCDNHP